MPGNWKKKRRKPPPPGARTEPGEPALLVSDQVVRLALKALKDWVWQTSLPLLRDRPVEKVAESIGLRRQGLTKLLRRKSKRPLFETFVRVCFLQTGRECEITLSAEGWEIKLRWRIERSNNSCVGAGQKRR